MFRIVYSTLVSGALALSAVATPAFAGPDPYMGDIVMVGGTYCPRGWADANGALLPIATYSALYSLFGTTYGGDGRVTFGLPDLRSRVPVGIGQGPGLTNVNQGAKFGAEQTYQNASTLAPHSHGATSTATSVMRAVDDDATGVEPAAASLAHSAGGAIYANAAPDVNMGAGTVTTTVSTTVANAGAGAPTPNWQPSLGIRFCVALQGAYPPRN